MYSYFTRKHRLIFEFLKIRVHHLKEFKHDSRAPARRAGSPGRRDVGRGGSGDSAVINVLTDKRSCKKSYDR